MKCAALVLAIVVSAGTPARPERVQPIPVKTLKVTVLSTMLAGDPGQGIGEWGFAALIEADGQRLHAGSRGLGARRRRGRRRCSVTLPSSVWTCRPSLTWC